jgi:hypothetical protein
MSLFGTNHENAQKKGSKVGSKSFKKISFLGNFTKKLKCIRNGLKEKNGGCHGKNNFKFHCF